MLERLRPDERTALLLHDAFDYSHAEIATMLGKSEEAVRQMASRARTRVREERPRLSVDRKKAAELTERFLRALQDANVEELRATLTADVVSVADGGGKVNAARQPVTGIDNVVRLLQGVQEKYWSDLRFERVLVNSLPGFVLYQPDDTLVGIVAFDFTPNAIRSIYIVLNPDKLPHTQ